VAGRHHIAVWSGLVLFCAGFNIPPCFAADLETIVRRGTAAIQSDWAADQEYAYLERDEFQKNDKLTSKTYRVVIIGGSDYNLPIAVNDQPLSPDQEKNELAKLKNEIRRRNNETPSERQQRVGHYKKQRDENGDLLLEFPNTFTFELVREETVNGYGAYVLSATPKERTGPMSRTAKVLTGMRGTLWIEKEKFHLIRAECNVVTSVPIFGALAHVLPGTHIELDMAPVTDSEFWLGRALSMELSLSKLWFKSMQVTRSTFSEYRLNGPVIDELSSKAGN